MPLKDKLKNPDKKLDDVDPVWGGPESSSPNGGITQSLLGRFLSCRERFRLYTVEGLAPHESFSAPIEYGNFWHIAEEHYPKGVDDRWDQHVVNYCHSLAEKYPLDLEKISHWYNMCVAQFPEYIDFYKDDEVERTRQNVFTERVFRVPYKLKWSGRTVYLRGKWDGLDLLDVDGYGKGLWFQENKTKSQIDQQKITRQLRFDLQTMFYLVALYQDYDWSETSRYPNAPILGVRYNVVKRSAHKSPDSMLKKLQEDVHNGRGGEWFGRWLVPVSEYDIEVFRTTCLDPILEWVCVWWDYVAGKGMTALGPGVLQFMMNYRYPYGVWNPLDEHGTDEYDHFFETGSRSGLRKITTLFPELDGI